MVLFLLHSLHSLTIVLSVTVPVHTFVLRLVVETSLVGPFCLVLEVSKTGLWNTHFLSLSYFPLVSSNKQTNKKPTPHDQIFYGDYCKPSISFVVTLSSGKKSKTVINFEFNLLSLILPFSSKWTWCFGSSCKNL